MDLGIRRRGDQFDAGGGADPGQFGAMFFPDQIEAYAEARRVLRPGGSFIFSMWDAVEQNDFAHVATEALASIFPDDPPGFLARTPDGHHDTDTFRAEPGAAAFGDVTIEARDEVSAAASPMTPAIAYCHGTPLRGEVAARSGPSLEDATRQVVVAIGARFGDGTVAGRIRAFVITAGEIAVLCGHERRSRGDAYRGGPTALPPSH